MPNPENPPVEETRARREWAPGLPWYTWGSVLVMLVFEVGLQWDVAWHRSVGMDSFFTARHFLMYSQVLFDGVIGASLILFHTFAPPPGPTATVRIAGFRGPLGAFVLCWGCFAMVAGAAFDMWWHSTYGIDVMVFSPPHSVIYLGAAASHLGTLTLICSHVNRWAPRKVPWSASVTLVLVATVLVGAFTDLIEWIAVAMMHSSIFYLEVAAVAPFLLALASRLSPIRWAQTLVALLYFAMVLLIIAVVPLYTAIPRIGPVTRTSTFMLPPGFPLLLMVPAVGLDLVRPKLAHLSKDGRALVLGALFLALFIAAQWPFGSFLASPNLSARWFNPSDGPVERAAVFWNLGSEKFWPGMIAAFVVSAMGMRVGEGFGEWFSRVRR